MTRRLQKFRPRSSALALEPRILFDAAGAMAAEEHLNKEVTAERTSSLEKTSAPAVETTTATTDATTTLLVIDARVANYQSLLADLPSNVMVRVIGADESGIDAISTAITATSGIESIQIISHGSSGSVSLGHDTLDSATLNSHSAQIQGWSAHLSSTADILIYGCNVASGSSGGALLTQLATITGADIAASSDATGSATRGGNWILEQQTGRIETKLVLSDQALANYTALLVDPVITTPATPSINEDSSYTFNGFTITYGGVETNLEAVVTITNTSSGRLVYNTVSDTQLAAQGDLASINAFLNGLSFQDTANWNGTVHIDVTINVYSGNYDLAHLVVSKSSAFDITVNSVNDAPSGTSNTVTISEDGSHVFTVADFGFSDTIDSNVFSAIRIGALPLSGTLTNNGAAVSTGQFISVADITANRLVYTPASNANGNAYTSFTFQVQDDGGTSNGGANLDASAKTMTINVTAVNDAPTTIDASQSVNKNGTLSFALTASDVDGAADISSYKIDTIPANGVLKYGSTTINTGDVITKAQAASLTFTPTTSYTGTTSFTFEAIDAGTLHSNVSTVTITVNSINIAPVITVPGTQTLPEDTSQTLTGISISDVDADSGIIQATISTAHGDIRFLDTSHLSITAGANGSHSVTVQGTLVNINAALAGSNLSYTLDHNYNGSDTISVAVDDLGNTGGAAQTDTKTISVTATPIADAPLTNAATLLAVNEDTLDPSGASVSSLLSGHFSDVDGNTLAGIAISADASTNDQGIWQYSANGGVSWQAIGAVTSNAALALNASAMLRFVPSANWNGTPGSLSIHAIDNSGSRTYSSSGSRQTVNISGSNDIDAVGSTLSTSITPVADPFVYVNDNYLRVDEGGTALLTSTILQITNVEAGATGIVYTVTGSTLSHGQLELDSAHDGSFSTVVANGTTFTQDDIDNKRLRYVHDGSEPAYATDQTLSYTVAEGGTSANRTLTIKVSPVNDVPDLYVPGETPPSSSLLVANVPAVGGTLTFSTGQLLVVDPDNTNQQLVFRLESLPTNGELTINGAAVAIGTVFNYANLGQLVYTHNGTTTSSDNFSVSLRDGAGGIVGTKTVNLTVGPDNHAPTGVGDLHASIYEDPLTSSGANNGWAINSLYGYEFSDTDVGASVGGIAIISNPNDAAQGIWEYSTDGTHWSAIGVVNDSGSALVLSVTTLVRFVPAGDYNGTPTPLTIRALDNTYTGGTSTSNGSETRVLLDTTEYENNTAIAANTNTINIRVYAVDDDPTLPVNTGGMLDSTTSITLNPLGANSFPTLVIAHSMLQIADIDSPTANLTYTLLSQPDHGYMARWQDGAWTQLQNGANFTQADIDLGNVRYVFTGTVGSDTSDHFDFTVTDGDTRIKPSERPGGIYADTSTTTLSTLTFNLTIDPSTPDPHPDGYVPPQTSGGANAAPVVATAGTLTLSEGDTNVVLTTAVLNATDTDPSASHLIYSLVSVPASGVLRLNGSALDINSTFTQDDIDNGRLTFSHNGYENFIDQFRFFVTDNNTVTTVRTVQIDVEPVNDRPVIATSADIKVMEGGSVVLQSGTLNTVTNVLANGVAVGAYDVDGGGDKNTGYAQTNTLTYTVSGLPTHGEIRLVNAGKTYDPNDATTYTVVNTGTVISLADISSGKLYYANDGSEHTSDTLTFTVHDNSGAANATASASLEIKIIPLNDDPVVQVNAGLRLADNKAIFEGDDAVISITELLGYDPDNTDSQIQFRITSNVQYGQLLLDGKILGIGSAFTNQDVIDGKLSYQHDGLEGTSDAFSFKLSDGGGGNEPAGTFRIDIIPLNDAPVITVPGTRTAAEEQQIVLTGISITDPDSINRSLTVDNSFGPLLLTLSVDHGNLTFSNTTGLTFENGTSNGAGTIAVTGTLGALNTALGSLSYQGNTNFIGNDTLTIRTDDLGHAGDVDRDKTASIGNAAAPGVDNLSDTKTVTITVSPVNDTPTLNGLSDNAYTEGASAIVLAPGATPADIDLDAFLTNFGDWGNATLTITRSGGSNAEDQFSSNGTLGTLTQGTNLTLNGSTIGSVTTNGGGTLKLTFADGVSQADVQSAIRQIAYSNSRQTLATGETANVTLSWVLDDGDTDPDRAGNGQGTGGHLSATVNQTITLTGSNDAPTRSGVASITPAALTVTEDITSGSGSTVTSLFTAKYSDTDSTNTLAGIAITANASTDTQGHWEYAKWNGLSFDAWSRVANDASITSSNALVLAAADKIRFVPDTANYNGTPGGLSVRLIDSSATIVSGTSVDVSDDITLSGGSTSYSNSSNAITLNATVTAVNDDPGMTISNTSFVATENTYVDLSTAGFSLADIEASRNEGSGVNQGKVQVTLSNAHGVIHVAASGATITGNDSGTVTVKGSLANVTSALNGLGYTPGNDPGTTETIAVVLSDLGNNGTSSTTAKTVSGSLSITVTQANDAPTATGSATLGAANEDAGQAGPIPNYPGSVSNPAPSGATISSLFSGNFSDVDTRDTNHTLAGVAIVGNAEDGTHGHWEYSTNGGSSWIQIPDGASLSDNAALVIAASNLLRFNPDVADYNGTPGSLTVRLSDGLAFSASAGAADLKILATSATDGWSNAITLGTSVSKINDAPIISSLHNDTVAFVEAVGVNVAGTAVFIDDGRDASLFDVDLLPAAGTTFNGATLTVQQQGAADESDFFVIQTGTNNVSITGGFTTPSGLKLFNNGSSVNYNGVSVATITNNSIDGTLVLTFNADASKAAVDAILHNLAFSSDNDLLPSGNKDIDITFTDGNATHANNDQGTGGVLATTATVHITLSPSNDAPSLDDGITISGTENIVVTTPVTPATIDTLLSSHFADSDNVSSLGGVAISAFSDSSNNADIHGVWQVSFNGGSTWVNLSALNTTAGGISATNALLLSATTQIQFVPEANANTAGLSTPPRLTVFAVEDSIPVGSSAVNAPAISFSSAASTLTTYDTTVDTIESRVAATSVNIDVQITEKNDAPTLGGTAWSGTLTEDPIPGIGTPTQQLISAASIGDLDLTSTLSLDSTTFGAGRITVHIASGTTGDKFTLTGDPAGVASTTGGLDGSDFVINLSNTATLSQVEAILEAIRFENTADSSPVGARTYTVTLNDGNNLDAQDDTAGGPALDATTTLSGQITISEQNDPPTVDLNGAGAGNDNTVTWTEGANTAHVTVNIAASAHLSDVDNTHLIQMVLDMNSHPDGNSEVVNIGGQNFLLGTDYANLTIGSFTISYVSNTGTFTILPGSGATETIGHFQTLLQGITYLNTSDNPTTGARTFSVQVTDAGVDNAGTSSGNNLRDSNTPLSTLTVTPSNDQPRLSGLDAASYHENALQTASDWLDQDISLTDIDNANYNGGTITISGLATADIVSLPTVATASSGSIQLSGSNVQYHDGSAWITVGTASGGNASNFVVTLNSQATAAIAERILENLTFRNTSDAPTVSRTLTYSVNDGSVGGTVLGATLGVTIVRDNDAPAISATTLGGNYSERNPTALQFVGGSISVSDTDLPTNLNGGSLTVHLDTYVSGDTLAVLNDSNAAGHIGVSGNTISYGGSSFATLSGGNGNDLVVSFNSATATPAALQALLAQLRFSNTTNDNPTANNSDPDRAFTITLNDGANIHDSGATLDTALTAALSGTITLTPTADAPTISAGNADFSEGSGGVILSPGLTLSDADDTQIAGATVQLTTGLQTAYDSLSVSGTSTGNMIAGTNIVVSSYDASTGLLTLSGTDTVAHYRTALQAIIFNNSSEDPTGNSLTSSRTVTWSVTDANSNGIGASGATGTTTSSITLYPVDDIPTISGLDASSANGHLQGGSAVVIDSDVALGDLELASRNNWAGAQITLSRVGSASADDLFGASGNLSFSSGDVVLSGVIIGTSTQADGTLAISFNTNASTTRVSEALQCLTYRNLQTTAGSLSYNSVDLRFTIDDQNTDITGSGSAGTNSGAQLQGSGGHQSAHADITIDINRLPIANADTASVNEGLATSATTTASGDLTPASTSGGNISDTDADNDTLTVQGIVAGNIGGTQTGNVGSDITGSYGKLNVAANGSYTYTLDNTQPTVQHLAVGETLSDVFTYTINDGRNGVSTATLTVTINGTNDSPAGGNDQGNAVEAGGLNNAIAGTDPGGNVLGNDTDLDTSDTHIVTAVRTGSTEGAGTAGSVGNDLIGQYGTLRLNADGSYTYTVNNSNTAVQALRVTGQTLTDYFNYTVSDNNNATDTALLSIIIDGRNDNPVATDDTGTAVESGQTTGSAASGNVLSNDTDVDSSEHGETRTVTALRSGTEAAGTGTAGTLGSALTGTYGSLTLNANGTYSYAVDDSNSTVNALKGGEQLTETFTYTMRDANGASDTAELTIRIDGRNDPPTANNDAPFTTAEDTVLDDIRVLDNDTDPDGDTLTVTNASIPANQGSVSINLDGTLKYTPASNFNGSATITYTISDGHGGTDSATVTITVTPASDPPVAVDDSDRSPDGRPVTVNALNNDESPDGETLDIISIAGTAVSPGDTITLPEGTVTLNADGTMTFTPDAGTQGDVVFAYGIRDEHGGSASASVTIAVVPAFVPPAPPAPPPADPAIIPPHGGDQAREPSVFMDGDTFTRIVRLPIPFQPTAFVNNTVEDLQQERASKDTFTLSSPDTVRVSDIQSHSIGASLGFDSSLFVQHAVRAAQAEGEFLEHLVDGRRSRINLSSDREIATPELFQPNPEQITPPGSLPDLPAAIQRDVPADMGASADISEDKTHQEQTHLIRVSRGAPSFSEQLRKAGNRMPVARHPIPHSPPSA